MCGAYASMDRELTLSSPLLISRSPHAGPEADPCAGMATLVWHILEDARGFAPERTAATAMRVV